MNGKIVGAALVSHHPGLMQCEEFRRLMGAGEDSDLIAGYARLRQRIEAARPDVVVIFDSHWFTTGYHLVDGGTHYRGTYISDEMPWYLHGVPYDYRGHPALASLVETVSRERGGYNRAERTPNIAELYTLPTTSSRLSDSGPRSGRDTPLRSSCVRRPEAPTGEKCSPTPTGPGAPGEPRPRGRSAYKPSARPPSCGPKTGENIPPGIVSGMAIGRGSVRF